MRPMTIIAGALILIIALHVAANAENNTLLRSKVFANPEVWKLTSTVSIDMFGKDLVRSPVRACATYVPNLPDGYARSSMLFGVDHTFDGIIFKDDLDGVFRSYGHHGTGDGPEFYSPTSIDVFTSQSYGSTGWSYLYHIYVTDWWNNRVKRLDYNWSTHVMTDIGAITGNGLHRPIDIDYFNNGNFGWEFNDCIWVLNCDDQLLQFETSGTFLRSYGSHGSGVGQFDNATALVCGRAMNYSLNPNFQQFSNTDLLYVADDGNRRLVKLDAIEPGPIQWVGFWDYSHLAGSIVDLEADNFGQIWVVWSTGEIFKFTDDLLLLAQFGSEGIGENQFYHPWCIANVGGIAGSGDMLITEDWTDDSGIQHYFIGADVDDLSVSLEDWGGLCMSIIRFKCVDWGYLSVRIYNESDELLGYIASNQFVESGWHEYFWSNDTYGNFRIEVELRSAYVMISTGQPANVATKDMWFYYCDLDFCSTGEGASYRPGDCDKVNDIDIDDVACIINCVFMGGTTWCYPYSADGNGSGDVDIDDVVYLIAYVFTGGPPPPTCSEWVTYHGVPACGE
ncbi:MAG: hypothetical protein ABIK83_13375 [Candidatus Zixiibacteriota bacterium]